MSYMSNFDISGYGLSAQRFRINLISSNIANANTTRTAEGGPYRRREAIFQATPFEKELNDKIEKNHSFLEYENPLDDKFLQKDGKPAIMSVKIAKVVRDDKDFKLKYDPQHPDANKEGYVAYPNINPVIEMADLVEATRAYQANVAAFQSAKSIAGSAIEMLQG